MNLATVKSLFFKVLIGCLVAAAGLAVVTILIGQFNDVCQRALMTIFLVALHAIVGISFISNNEKQDTFESLAFFTNATFGIIVLSFMTSVLGTWGVLPGGLVGKLYALYFVLLFAVLHGEVLAKMIGKQANIDRLIQINFLFMAIVVVLLIPLIFIHDAVNFSPLYYRGLAACGIVDATLTLISIILHKLYVQKHPTVADPVFNAQAPGVPGVPGQTVPAPAQPPQRRMNIFVVLLLVYVGLQIAGGLFFMVMGAWQRNH